MVLLDISPNHESRLCYKVRFESDGVVDYVPVSDVEQGLYRLISE